MLTEMELTLEQTQQGVSYEVSTVMDPVTPCTTLPSHSRCSDIENMLSTTEYYTYVFERVNTIAGIPVKKILLYLILSDHRLFKDDSDCDDISNAKRFRGKFSNYGSDVISDELSAEQAFWLRISNPTIESSNIPPVKVEVPSELPKVSLVNASLKKLKLHLAQLDSVVKKRTTPDARTEGEWGKAHIDYLKYTQEQADILRGIEYTCILLAIMPNAINLSAKKVAVTPKNKVKKVRFAEPLTSSSNIKQVESSNTSNSNTPMLSSKGLKCSTSKCRSKLTGNKRNDRISQTPSRNMKNNVESQPRKVNKKNRVVEPIRDVYVKHSQLNANSEPICATCNKSMFDGIHDKYLLDFVENVNSHAKSAKKHIKQNIWKPMGHVFTEVGFKWKPTGRTFTIDGNSCPLTRITSANVVPPKKTTSHSIQTQKPELKVYSR
ncbi:hypothetical protein Tco_1122683 [Tanacetum coccineum]|uniref:Uncharacterized protein n=1 Tax=Tanacetum coccineum TaxID=301880 RepID=A0ABQ5J3T3_9ASTR